LRCPDRTISNTPRALDGLEVVVMSHDELIEERKDSVSHPSLHDASGLFVFSLSTRWRFLRPFPPVSRMEES
jgi:hypothetical protein